MSDNGSGTYVVNSAGQPVVSATPITATAFNAFTADVATALSNRICKDGQTTPTANIPFGGYKATGLAAATARTDGASIATIQDGTGVYVGTVGGTADVITLTPSPAIAAYAAGQTFQFLASGANTTNVTVAVSGLAAKAITKYGATALRPGDFPSGAMVTITYDGTRFIAASVGTDGQITFPATQNASSDANTLDDYEEGTWTPSVGGDATYTTRSGTYTKIGRVVFINMVMQINVLGTGSTSDVSGLPFTNAGEDASLSFGLYSSLATAVVSLYGRINGGGNTTLSLFGSTAAATGNSGTSTIFGNGTALSSVTGFYIV